jgi:hypothetical protein
MLFVLQCWFSGWQQGVSSSLTSLAELAQVEHDLIRGAPICLAILRFLGVTTDTRRVL